MGEGLGGTKYGVRWVRAGVLSYRAFTKRRDVDEKPIRYAMLRRAGYLPVGLRRYQCYPRYLCC